MKHIIILLFLYATINSSFAQRPVADQIKTSKGMLTIQPILHGSLILTWDKKTIYVDPYGGAKAYAGMSAPDFILITDIHPDHLDTATLNAIEITKATFIVPQAVADKLPAKYKGKVVVLNNEKSTNQQGFSISPDSKHTKGRGNGYILTLGGKMVYISGDTEDIAEMRSLKNIDVAFVCMNLPYTMDINQASSAVLEFKPAIVYPYHYRGKDGLSDTEAFKKLVNDGNKTIDVRLKNWYPDYSK